MSKAFAIWLAFCVHACQALASSKTDLPRALMLSLQMTQDKIVLGGSIDEEQLWAALLDVEGWFRAEPNWKAVGPAGDLLVAWCFSGGDLTNLGSRVDEAAHGAKPKILEAALAFAEGNGANALDLLRFVDHRSLPAPLAGLTAVVRAGLEADANEIVNALALFADARLLAPGGAVEELALRSEIRLLDDSDDRLLHLVRRYLYMFGRSPRSEDVRGRLERQFRGALEAETFDRLERLSELMSISDIERWSEFLIDMARRHVLSGRLSAASLLANQALLRGNLSKELQMRALLYRAAGRPGRPSAQEDLALVRSAGVKLAAEDELLAIAIESLNARAEGSVQWSHEAEFSPNSRASPFLSAVERGLRDADALLKEFER